MGPLPVAHSADCAHRRVRASPEDPGEGRWPEVALPTATAATLAANTLDIFLPAKIGASRRQPSYGIPPIRPLPHSYLHLQKATDLFALFAQGSLAPSA